MSANPSAKNKVLMFRVENPNTYRTPDGVVSHEDLIGQWFSPDLDYVTDYIRKSTQMFGRPNVGKVVDGARLLIAYTPIEDVNGYHASNHPVASSMDFEPNNYIIPRDGSIEITELPLDEVLGELRGNMGSVEIKEAKRRVIDYVGPLLIESETNELERVA